MGPRTTDAKPTRPLFHWKRTAGTTVDTKRTDESQRATWTEVEPGRRARWARLEQTIAAAIVILIVGGIAVGATIDIVRWENLRARGRNARAEVWDAWTEGSGSDTSHYLDADPEDCEFCSVTVEVSNLRHHPIGSHIQVRYDPEDTSNAVALVDSAGDSPIQFAFGAVFVIVAGSTGLVARAIRRRRRALALIGSGRRRQAVRFRAWRRRVGDQVGQYLVLRSADTEDRLSDLLCVPVHSGVIPRFPAGRVLYLYGSGEPGTPAVLRSEGALIIPMGPTRPGSWEHDLRAG